MEVAVDPTQRDAEAEYVLDLCARSDNPMEGAVLGGDPGAPEFASFVRRYRDIRHFKGVRGGFRRSGEDPSPEAIRDVRLLGELGMRFDLGAGPPFAAAIKLVEACPDTIFILNHCGNPRVQDEDRTFWERELAKIAMHPNVVCKVSGIIASAKPGAWKATDLEPFIIHVLREFGPDRVIFASDWPVCTQVASLAEWVNALKWIVRDQPETARRKLFHDNAMALYDLT
jgi:predicted TIM-barrel fold metal-dependent hydrolase